MNVVSVKGGKVHLGDSDSPVPFPLCPNATRNTATKFRTTDAPVDCKACTAVIERRAAKAADAPSETETEMPAKKTAPEAKPDTDALISDVHDVIDRMGSADADALDALATDAEEIIRTLPTNKRTALRKAVNDAKAARLEALTPPAPEATPDESAVAAMSDNPEDYPGVTDVMRQGVDKVREGVELGMKLTTAGEEMARIMLNMRSLVPNPETGLPDITAIRKTTRNFAARIYADARKDVSTTDVERLAAHNSLVKATQNKMSDVLVDWLNALDAPESRDVVRALYPAAADAERPSEAIRALYAERDISLPEKGRTELMREHRKRKALEAARKEREELLDSEEPGSADELEKVDARIRELAADLGDAAEPEPEKTDAQRVAEAVEKMHKTIETTGKRMAKLSGPEKRKARSDLYALIREAADTFELDLSALVETEE